MLTNFAREERGRMLLQETRKRESMSLSTMNPLSGNNRSNPNSLMTGDFVSEAAEAQQKSLAMSQAMEENLAAKFNLKNPVAARVGAQAAMKFMTGLKRRQGEGAGGTDAADPATAAASAVARMA
ncbi:unnamed protein product, partial [Ectocarpus fasciculatus]